MTVTTKITVTYTSIDHCRVIRSFKTLTGARKFAANYVGHHPEMGCGYAISGDGIGKVTVKGCKLADLFRSADDVTDAEFAEMVAEVEAEEQARIAQSYADFYAQEANLPEGM